MSCVDKLIIIGDAFESFKETGGPPRADPEEYTKIIEQIRAINTKHESNNKAQFRPNIETITPNQNEWGVILSYYYSIHDQTDKKEPNIELLSELEVWFIQFIEPRPIRSNKMGFRMDLWKDREISKYKLMVSDYCPTIYKSKISQHNIDSLALSGDWINERIKKIEEIYRNTPTTIIRKNKNNNGVVRSSTNQVGVVNLDKILGMK